MYNREQDSLVLAGSVVQFRLSCNVPKLKINCLQDLVKKVDRQATLLQINGYYQGNLESTTEKYISSEKQNIHRQS